MACCRELLEVHGSRVYNHCSSMTVICRYALSCVTSVRSFRPRCLFACLYEKLRDRIHLNLVLRTCIKILWGHLAFVVFLLLGDSPASEFYMPTFRNTLFHLHTYPPKKMEQTERSEASAYKIERPKFYPTKRTEHSQQGQSFKSRRLSFFWFVF